MSKKEPTTTSADFPDYDDSPDKTKAIPTTTEAEIKARRIAALEMANAGLTHQEFSRLKAWWQDYRLPDEPETLPPDVLVDKFLYPPPRWAKGSPSGYMGVTGIVTIARGNKLEYLDPRAVHKIGIDVSEEDAQRIIAQGIGKLLPAMTLRVIAAEWPKMVAGSVAGGVRGQLVLYSGARSYDSANGHKTLDQLIDQSEQMGLIKIEEDQGKLSRPIETLGPCPGPILRDPESRVYLPDNYEPASTDAIQGYPSLKPKGPRSYKLELSIGAILSLGAPVFGPGSQGGFGPEDRPLVRVRGRKAGLIAGAQLTGNASPFGLLAALKICADPALRFKRHEPRPGTRVSMGHEYPVMLDGSEDWHSDAKEGDAPIEILDPIPPAYQEYARTLADFMASHPGVRSDSPGFPAWPQAECVSDGKGHTIWTAPFAQSA